MLNMLKDVTWKNINFDIILSPACLCSLVSLKATERKCERKSFIKCNKKLLNKVKTKDIFYNFKIL